MTQIISEGQRWQVQGDMTMPQVNKLLAQSQALPMADRLEVDLSAVSEVDTATISVLFEWLRRAQDQKCELKFIHFPKNLTSLATLYGVLDLIPHVAA